MCSEYGVSAYPTLLFFPIEQQNPTEQHVFYFYEGSRSIEALESFVKGGYIDSKADVRFDEIPQNLSGGQLTLKYIKKAYNWLH